MKARGRRGPNAGRRRRGRGARRRWLAAVAGVSALAVAGTATYELTGAGDETGPPRVGAVAQAPWSQPVGSAPPVLAAAAPTDGDAIPTTAGVTAALTAGLADPALAGARVAVVVADGESSASGAGGSVVLDRGGSTPMMPASTTKLATAVAALHVLPPDRRITTKVVAAPGGVVLVGGGDPTLTVKPAADAGGYPQPASLDDLAERTARALIGRGETAVRVWFDASLYEGPAMAPAWKPTYVTAGDVAPVSALEVDEGRSPARRARAADPAAAAGLAFAEALSAHGITVTGGAAAVSAAKAPPVADVLASVQSAPLTALVDRMLGRSDNDLAEALGRQVALAGGRPASFSGAASAIRAALGDLGLDPGAFSLVDASGLSRADRIEPRALVDLLRLAASPDHPRLRPVLEALPVAGFTGTLADRYGSPPAAGAAGLVRAKTGTLNGAVALAGVVADRDGRLLAFAVLVNELPVARTAAAEAALDRIAATLGGCGCR